jgi:hypothetical protein
MDTESYEKGYADAMRAVGRPPAKPAPKPAPKLKHATAVSVAGQALGYLVVFPVFVGLVFGLSGAAFGGSFDTWFLVWGGLAFAFGLVLALVKLGVFAFVRAWPLVVVALAVYFVVKYLV